MGLSNYSSHPGQDTCKSWPRHFLQAIGQHASCIESRSPDPLNKSHLSISHIWACPIIAVTLAKMLVNLRPDIFYQLLANTLFALRAGHLTLLKSPIWVSVIYGPVHL